MISVDDKFGVTFVSGSDWNKYIGYYQTLFDLRPILRSPEMNILFTGFYINIDHDGHSVRISYFCKDDVGQPDRLKELCKDLDLFPREGTTLRDISLQSTDSLELMFRNYLHTYAQIGLDLVYADSFKVLKIFFEFRGDVFGNRSDYRNFLESTFKKFSPYYCDMDPKDKKQFWNIINGSKGDWIHMMINMIICGDLELDIRTVIQRRRVLNRHTLYMNKRTRFFRRQHFKREGL